MQFLSLAFVPAVMSFALLGPGTDDPKLVALLKDSDAIVLGEIHGSVQVPAVALEVVDAALIGDRATVLGLEIWATEQARIDTYLQSKGTEADQRTCLEGSFWRATGPRRSPMTGVPGLQSGGCG